MIDYDDPSFKLHVKEIVSEVLSTRDLTVKEATKIEEAIRDSIELVWLHKFQEHSKDLKTEIEDGIDEIIAKAVNSAMNRFYMKLGIIGAILGIIGAIIKFV